MKNLAMYLVVAVLSTSLIGCNKKQSEEVAIDGLNGVSTESIVPVGDSMLGESASAVPVIIDNAPMVENAVTEMDTGAQAIASSNETATPKAIQQALKNAGLYTGKVDGTIGPKTKRAIEAFQTNNGLKADGKVGRKTWKALSAYLNMPAEVSNPSADSQAIDQ
jgi:murein L,D-transpeptidase YcbB/YkuD